MDQLFKAHIKNKEFSHGYLMAGDLNTSRASVFEAVRILLDLPKGALETHPDYFYQKYDLLGIDNSRELIYKASQTPFLGGNKIFIIEAGGFTIESANALLKLLEDPPQGTYFFIIVSTTDSVLPTLRSRLIVVENKIVENAGKEKERYALEFLQGLPSKRMEAIEKISKDKQAAIEFLNELELILSKNKKTENLFSFASALDKIRQAKGLLSSRFSSQKIILEHLALTLPRMI